MNDKFSDMFFILITAAAFVIVVAGMRAIASIINPFLLAIFIASLCGPLLYGLQRLGVPKGLGVSAIVLGLLVVSLLIMVFLGKSLNSLSQQIPTYQERLTTLVSHVVTWLNSHGLELDINNLAINEYFNPRVIMSLVTYGLSILRVLFTNLFLILLIVLFFLLEAAAFPKKLEVAFPESKSALGHFQTITTNVNRYMGIKAVFSLATGFFIWIELKLIGVDFAGTWGLLAFFLNFVPAIGSIIAAIPAIIWALVQLGLSSALLTMLAYLFVNIVLGNLLEPRFMGQRLGLSPLVVILSLIFWGWVLGPIGMLLSVPLTMIAKIALAADENTRWIAVLLG